MVFIEGLVTQIIFRARVPILVNTADRVKSPTLSPGVLMWGVNICQIPHPQGQYFWSIDVDSLCWPGGGGGGGVQLTGALLHMTSTSCQSGEIGVRIFQNQVSIKIAFSSGGYRQRSKSTEFQFCNLLLSARRFFINLWAIYADNI